MKNRTSLYTQRFVSQLRKCRNLKFSANFCKNAVDQQVSLNYDDIHVFAKTNASSMSMYQYTNLACGYGFTVLCTDQQQLVVSGVNSNSQLGLPSYQENVVDKFKEVTLPFTKPDSQILDISCGRLHTIASTTEGLFAAGCNKLGQCGLDENEEITTFTKIPWSIPAPVKQVVCGLDHTLLLTEEGDVWSCGWGADGQTGLGHTDEQRSLARLQIPSDVKITKVATKADSCLALTKCGEVFSWGNSEYSQLGFQTKDTLIPTPIKITSLQNIVDIAISNSVGLALTDEGHLLCWGYGLLGNTSEPFLNPVPQKLTSLDKCVVKVCCGLDHYVFFTDDNEAYIWGKLNHTVLSRLPKKADLNISNITRINCGVDCMGVIVDDGT